MKFYKYQGAGNDFLIADNRDGSVKLSPSDIAYMCDRRYGIGADGLMLLGKGEEGHDFTMEYFNSDGTGGMMCGNGGRCIVAFAADLGITSFNFTAPDGEHKAEILAAEGKCKTVRLKMIDVDDINPLTASEGVVTEYFINTGARHYVTFVKDIENLDVNVEGAKIRWQERFAPEGVNANFTEEKEEGVIAVRTFEKGVEAETYACGTGTVAMCIASFLNGVPAQELEDGRFKYDALAKKDRLAVDFVPGDGPEGPVFEDVWLTGPATFVATVEF
ncbi:MAG: diaminopimelate epimerase [Bacteroidales bacterium]|nr:diaminopimelate epimerase [Bacteroidales bacterium]